MEEKQKTKTVREEFAEKFLRILESDQPLKWVQGWTSSRFSAPYNGQSGRKYNGINRLVLMFQAMEKSWTDPRFYTFHQVAGMDGCKIRAKEKATAVEYWLLWDTKDKRSVTFSEYERLLRDDPSRKEDEFRLYTKTAYVFNAAQIEGLQPLPQLQREEWECNRFAKEVMDVMAENMGVPILFDSEEAYYSTTKDTIHLPPKENFISEGEYIGTTLHELSHATGAEKRLNRSMTSYYEDPEQYAMEELRAEIASTFVSAEIGIEMPESVVQNHLAYVSSWATKIRENANVLFAAIKDADQIADYMVEQGRVEALRGKMEVTEKMPKELDGFYEIWQLKDTPENKALLFSEYAVASMFRLTENRYEKVYEGAIDPSVDSLDKIYYQFNMNHPKDFRGHSLSVSDVVVLNQDGKRTGWYCDSFGFQEIKDFCKTRHPTEKKGRCR